MYLAKYDTNGTKQWTKLFGANAKDTYLGSDDIYTVSGHPITVDSKNNAVYVTGNTQGSLDGYTILGGKDGYVAKYDLDGNPKWIKQFGATGGGTEAFSVAVHPSGAVYTVGRFNANTFDGITRIGIRDAFITNKQSDADYLK